MRTPTTILLFCAIFALAACGGPNEYAPQGTALAPAATAKVTTQRDEKTHVTRLSIEVDHLPPPDRATPGGQAYVVWARPDHYAMWTRVGTLEYDDDKRRGRLDAASVAQTAFDLIVTVEPEVAPLAPTESVVLAQHVDGD